MAYQSNITKKSEDLSEWYNKIVLEAELADYGPSKGTMIIRPYGYAIWEQIQKAFDSAIKAKGVENAYFPIFIPYSFLQKEQTHMKGFSPELAVVTIGGGEELKEPLVVRPTSETIMHDAYSRWIHSWRDLPVMINQWNNAVRWEKRTYLFLRTTEFLWQEGHTAHATHEEAQETMEWAMEEYAKLYREHYAIPGYVGRKSPSERFAGADDTLTYESLMPEGKALQSCTSHDLGQNFSKAFDIKFQDKNGEVKYAWLTSWGLSTRSIGGLVMMHGDDKGLRLPPKLAPVQVIVLPVKNETEILKYSSDIANQLTESTIRAKVDARDDETLGFRINKWEVKGAPLRLEIGSREMEQGVLTAVRRDTGEKQTISTSNAAQEIKNLLDAIQKNLYAEAEQFLKENTHEVESYDEFKRIMKDSRGFIKTFWCEDEDCEKKIKDETKASTRCLPLDAKEEEGTCICCNKPAVHKWLFAQAY